MTECVLGFWMEMEGCCMGGMKIISSPVKAVAGGGKCGAIKYPHSACFVCGGFDKYLYSRI